MFWLLFGKKLEKKEEHDINLTSTKKDVPPVDAASLIPEDWREVFSGNESTKSMYICNKRMIRILLFLCLIQVTLLVYQPFSLTIVADPCQKAKDVRISQFYVIIFICFILILDNRPLLIKQQASLACAYRNYKDTSVCKEVRTRFLIVFSLLLFYILKWLLMNVLK